MPDRTTALPAVHAAGFALLLFASLPSAQGIAPAVRGQAPDRDRAGFEDGVQPFVLASLDGQPPEAELDITTDPGGVHDGTAALKLSYDPADPVSILGHPVLMTDLVRLRYWVKSEGAITWVVAHTDRDGAAFAATVSIPAGEWVLVDLSPDDFVIDPSSPVWKPAMEPARNGFWWAAFDLEAVFGQGAPNTVWIDTVLVERPPLDLVPGPVLVDGTAPLTLDRPTRIEGDLVVLQQGQFESTTTRLVVAGDVIVVGPSSRVVVRDGTLRLEARFRYERQLVATQGGVLRFENLLTALGANTGLVAGYGGGCEIIGTRFAHGILTAGTIEDGRIELRDVDAPGEFILRRDGILEAEDVEHLLVWLVGDEGTVASVSLPEGQDVTWSLPGTWRRRVSLTDVGTVDFGLIVEEHCALLVRDGTLRAVGVVFSETDGNLADYRNGTFFVDQAFDWPARYVRFRNVDVTTWNFYAMDSAHVTVRDSLFGEVLTFGQSSMHVFDSTCDGTGGYLGARDDSTMVLTNTDVLCEVTCDGDAFLDVSDALITGNVTAAESALIHLHGCDVEGELIEIDDGEIVVD